MTPLIEKCIEKYLGEQEEKIAELENNLNFKQTVVKKQAEMIIKLHRKNLELKLYTKFFGERLINKYAENPLTDYLVKSKGLVQ